MSFRENGNRRFGHVPPAQYGLPGSQGQNRPSPLHRQSSFDNGDDAGYSDLNNGGYNSEVRSNPPSATMPNEDMYMASPSSTGPMSAGRSSFGSLSPALSGYQHQFQPMAAEAASQVLQPAYNPRDFARAQSQPGQYNPQVPYSNPAASNNGLHYQQPAPINHQPYNPAAYSPTAPSQFPPIRQPTLSSYHSSYHAPYVPTGNPAAPDVQHTQQQYGAPPVPPRPAYEPPLGTPAYPQSSTVPAPRQNFHSHLPASPRPPNGATQPQYSSYTAFQNEDFGRSSRSSGRATPPFPTTSSNPSNSPGNTGLQRHPTFRPLPSAPTDQDSIERDWRSDEELTQDQIYADIGDVLGTSRAGRRQRADQHDGDLLDSELRQLQRLNTGGSIGDARMDRATVPQRPGGPDYDDDDSDAEAVAGLEAMRIAEEQDTQMGSGGGMRYSYEGRPAPLSRDDSSDSDYHRTDLGLVSGGYDAHMSYGGDFGGASGHSSEREDQSRPLPTPRDLGRSESYSRGPGISVPGEGEVHPFPALDGYSVRVDTYGTGGLQRPSSHPHRLSFDEGDELSMHSRTTDSRQSGRSGSESPIKEDMREMFYHPGIGGSQRPLPEVPATLPDARTPQPMQSASYRNQHSYTSSVEAARAGYVPSGVETYPSLLSSTGTQFVPRSSSLSSHSSTPQTQTPVRSKTDAEERARQRAYRQSASIRSSNLLDGYDTPSLSNLDLPALPDGDRRKKFSATKLSTADFKMCTEPWALSGIEEWVRKMAGGDTGDGESDLYTHVIEDALVALFTHKVPTMNTADAETLSQRVVRSMYDAGVLFTDEEWVRFGQGSVSGVLWQLTGSGCYSPKVHEYEIGGRCYSHHCTRTLKKIDLQTAQLEPSRKSEDWMTFFKLTKEQIEGASKKEIERQNNLHEIVMSEDIFMDQLNVLRILYRDTLATHQPPIVAPAKISKFIKEVFGKVEVIKVVNENFLLAQLKYRQKEQGPWVIGFSDIFREWIRKAKSAYLDYSAGFPKAIYLVRREADRNVLFRQFLDHARDNKLSGRLDYNTYLKAPITRLQRYTLLLGTVLKNMTQETEERKNLAVAIEEIKAVTLECDAKVDEQNKKVAMAELGSKLSLRPGMHVQFNLEQRGRQLIYRGDLQRAGTNRFTWLETHAILFDHYFVMAKSVENKSSAGASSREKHGYDVSKTPIPMQLLIVESTDDDPVQKSAVKGLGAVTTVTKAAPGSSDSRMTRSSTNTNLERISTLEQSSSHSSAASIPTMNTVTRIPTNDDAKAMYPFRIKHLGKATYTLYAPSAQNRREWCDKILEAKTSYAAALHEQGSEPFRLRVMADSAFAFDQFTAISLKSVVSVPGTALDRAVRQMDEIYGGGARPGPVCRAQVNCATAFNCYGKSMVAIGTDYGVYTAEASNPRGWSRAIQMAKVTQISVLEEFSLCIILADKSLIAYHLDVVVPVSNFPAPNQDSARKAPQKLSGSRDVAFFATACMKDRTLVFYKKKEQMHSTFKVLEPVYQKSGEKKTRIFGKKFSGTTEFFREFDEFYIPTECFTMNLFHSYIAISTAKGFELMTLDKKVPISIPDTKNPAIASIAARLQDQRPLGMFRLSDAEFLLCYQECGVYVDKHGEVSRSVIMEFVGKAKTAAMYGAYLVLFDDDFVEVRNAENGRLRQVIAGREVRCLDSGINPNGAGGATIVPPNGNGRAGTHNGTRTLKLAMCHPEVAGNQIVLEMVLNEGHLEDHSG